MSDVFGDLFAGRGRPTAAKPKPEKGVQIHGRAIDATYYVRADDVIALLKANDLLPQTRARLEAAVARLGGT